MQLTKNFQASELSCRCCGFLNVSWGSLEKLQRLRDKAGPLKINSACRCPLHNAREGGSPTSQHRSTKFRPSTAFDISLKGHDKQALIRMAEQVGFKGIGINYKTFIHVDDRRRRARW